MPGSADQELGSKLAINPQQAGEYTSLTKGSSEDVTAI